MEAGVRGYKNGKARRERERERERRIERTRGGKFPVS